MVPKAPYKRVLFCPKNACLANFKCKDFRKSTESYIFKHFFLNLPYNRVKISALMRPIKGWGSKVVQWLKDTTNQTVHLTVKKVLLCTIASKPLSCINTTGLITLQYIYSSRCLKKLPSFAQLKSKILDVQNIEKYIAIKNNRLKKHEIKWKGF